MQTLATCSTPAWHLSPLEWICDLRDTEPALTSASGSTGADVLPHQANGHTGLLDGSGLLEAHGCDSLQTK